MKISFETNSYSYVNLWINSFTILHVYGIHTTVKINWLIKTTHKFVVMQIQNE